MPQETLTKPDYAYHSADGGCAHHYLLGPVKKLIKDLAPRGHVLDLGCGNGYVTNELAKAGHKVSGIDLSASGIKIAQQAFPGIDFRCGNVEEDLVPGAFPADSFEAIVSTEVVEHVYQPRQFAKNAFRLLRPGGHLIVSTPYHGYLKNLVLALTGKMDTHFTALWDGGHIKFWSRATLSQLLTEQGFTGIRFIGVGRVPYIWKSMILVARKPPTKSNHK